jgi:Fur family ferric uptake transcriptional regulator
MSEMEALLKESGLKSTKQRIAILEVLKKKELPTAAEDVFIELKKMNVPANLSTVYRILETMSERGLIKKFGLMGEGKSFYELFRVVHRHFLVCIGCKKMLPIQGCPLSDYERELEDKTDYKISGHRLDIYGYCPECIKNRKNIE